MRYLFTEHTRTVAGVNFSPDGKLLASASWDGTVKLWNMESGKLLRTFVEPQIEVASVDSRLMA
jgi:WD40 repeat protein